MSGVFKVHTHLCKHNGCPILIESGLVVMDNYLSKSIKPIIINSKFKNIKKLYNHEKLTELINAGSEVYPCPSMLGSKYNIKNAGICIIGTKEQLDIICSNFTESSEFRSIHNISIANLCNYSRKNGDHTMEIAQSKQFTNRITKYNHKNTILGIHSNANRKTKHKFGFSFGKMNIRETIEITALRELKEEFKIVIDKDYFMMNKFILYEDEGRLIYGINLAFTSIVDVDGLIFIN